MKAQHIWQQAPSSEDVTSDRTQCSCKAKQNQNEIVRTSAAWIMHSITVEQQDLLTSSEVHTSSEAYVMQNGVQLSTMRSIYTTTISRDTLCCEQMRQTQRTARVRKERPLPKLRISCFDVGQGLLGSGEQHRFRLSGSRFNMHELDEVQNRFSTSL